jgi:hypothetical protein
MNSFSFSPTATIVGWLIIGVICGGISSTIAWNRAAIYVIRRASSCSASSSR